MDKPIEEQIKEFWEWCGFKFEQEIVHSKQIGREFEGFDWTKDVCVYPDGRREGIEPSIDLNNLFKYAVPKQIRRYEDNGEHTASAWSILFISWVHSMMDNDPDPALALFWALWQVKPPKEKP